MIADNMQAVGAARSIVIDEDSIVLCGNGALDAAGQAGITRVQVVEADGNTLIAVRRRGLTDAQKIQLSIADNRTNELSDWSPDALKALQSDGVALDVFWTPTELEALFEQTPDEEPEASVVAYTVLVTCRDEAHQQEVLARLKDDGLDCRAKAD